MTANMPSPEAVRFRRLLHRALTLIPTHRESPRLADDIARRLCEACSEDDRPSFAEAGKAVHCALTLLDAFGALTTGDEGYRTAGQVSTYFLRSLAWYLERGVPLVSGWHARGVQGDDAESPFDRAPKFLEGMECRRLRIAAQMGLDAPSSRHQEVALILIKGVHGEDVSYLHRFDADAGRYQLIGGRVEPGETPLAAALREAGEELGLAIDAGARFHLWPLLGPHERICLTAISPTYGALTDYTFNVFGASVDSAALALSEADRWVSVDEMLAGRTDAGEPTGDPQLMRELDHRLPGGLRGAPIPPVGR